MMHDEADLLAGGQGRDAADLQPSAAGLLLLAFGCLWLVLAWWWPVATIALTLGVVLDQVLLRPLFGARKENRGGEETKEGYWAAIGPMDDRPAADGPLPPGG